MLQLLSDERNPKGTVRMNEETERLGQAAVMRRLRQDLGLAGERQAATGRGCRAYGRNFVGRNHEQGNASGEIWGREVAQDHLED
jgi:hypothetical protein